MAHYLAELYSPKSAWLALDQNGRRRLFETVGAGMGALTALGVEALAFGETEAETLNAPDQKFFAIWRAPDAAAIAALVSGISASGWLTISRPSMPPAKAPTWAAIWRISRRCNGQEMRHLQI